MEVVEVVVAEAVSHADSSSVSHGEYVVQSETTVEGHGGDRGWRYGFRTGVGDRRESTRSREGMGRSVKGIISGEVCEEHTRSTGDRDGDGDGGNTRG